MRAALSTDPLETLLRRRSAKWARYPPDVLPAWVAEMDFRLAEPIRATLATAIEIGDTGYAEPGAAALGEAFAGFARRRLGWEVDPRQVVATRDVVSGIAELIELLSEPGEGVVVNPPVYPPFFSVVRERRRSLVEVPLLDGGRLDVEGIEAAFATGARALVLCSPHNPTGTVPGAAELAAVAEAAVRHDAWVLADEIHAPLTLPGRSHVPFLRVSDAARERGIALSSASKAFNLAGLGCAQIVTAGGAAQERIAALPRLARHPGHLGVIAAVAAFTDAGATAWLEEALATIDSNRALLAELLAARLPEVGYRPPEASYLAWLDLSPLGLGRDPAATLLERGRVALSPGPEFGRGGEGRARLNFGTSPELLAEIVERIARAVGR